MKTNSHHSDSEALRYLDAMPRAFWVDDVDNLVCLLLGQNSHHGLDRAAGSDLSTGDKK